MSLTALEVRANAFCSTVASKRKKASAPYSTAGDENNGSFSQHLQLKEENFFQHCCKRKEQMLFAALLLMKKAHANYGTAVSE